MHHATILVITTYIFLIQCSSLNENEEFCVNELKLDRQTIEAWNIEPILPEDNEDLSKYLPCYWRKLGYLKDNNDFDYIKIGEVINSDLKHRIHSNINLNIAVHVVNICKNNVNNDTDVGLKTIQMWNCLNLQTENVF